MKKHNELQRDPQNKSDEVVEKPATKRREPIDRTAAGSAGMLIKTGLRAGMEQDKKRVQ